jgi:hypothetical protein
MTTIVATCETCGDVGLAPGEIVLQLTASRDANNFAFSCPRCKGFNRQHADDVIVRLLVYGGVMPTVVHVPAEALEPKEGPPISHDDILEFHEAAEALVEHVAEQTKTPIHYLRGRGPG